MKRWLTALFVVAAFVPAVRAHFIWIVPDKDGKTVQVIFSDSLQPDDPKLLDKIGHMKAHLRRADGEGAALDLALTKEAYVLKVQGEGARLVHAVCPYGVIARNAGEPFLLNYYAAALVGATAADALPAKLYAPEAGSPLQVLPVKDKPGAMQVLWEGKPLANAEVVVLVPGKDKTVDVKASDKGAFELPAGDPGFYGIRARHVEMKAGKRGDKEYKEVRHYATLVVQLAGAAKQGATDPVKADPAASQLLADARANRALWSNFPGFSADVEVNFNGKAAKGKVTVGPEGKPRFGGLDKEYEAWARRELASIASHRLDSGSPRDTPCAFADDVKDHPLGRAVRVLNDELHSSYRIRDKEIVVVNRAMKDRRFTITVLQSQTNAEGKLLTTSFVVDYWNLDSGDLVRSDATAQSWARVGKYDLPVVTRIISALPQKGGGDKEEAYGAQSLTLSNHKLLEAK